VSGPIISGLLDLVLLSKFIGLRLAPSKEPHKVVASLLSLVDGKRSSLRNVVFSSVQNSERTKPHKPSDYDCYTPPSESFRFHQQHLRTGDQNNGGGRGRRFPRLRTTTESSVETFRLQHGGGTQWLETSPRVDEMTSEQRTTGRTCHEEDAGRLLQ
jgi:hypothetical protein